MIKCCKCDIRIILPYNPIDRHGRIICPECKEELYVVGTKVYPMAWVEIDDENKEVKINTPGQ